MPSTVKAYSGSINGQVYRKWPIDVLETICYMNMGLFCLTKLFVLESSDEKGQIIVAYISGTITFVLFVAALVYHLFTEFMSKKVIWRKIETKWRKVNEDNMIVCEENVLI